MKTRAAAISALLSVALPAAAAGTVGTSEPNFQSACPGTNMPTQRFVDNGDGTVTDSVSKLMWMRCALGQSFKSDTCTGAAGALSWPQAQRQAQRLNQQAQAFYNDWRVPTLRELASITDSRCATPRTHPNVFPHTPAASFWTATARPGEPAGQRVFVLSFGWAGAAPALKDEQHHVRLVRTGP
jgi:hypothetical protein